MTASPLRIFLSSTAEDLTAHRQAVSETIDHFGQLAIRMEAFGARPGDPLSVCRKLVRNSDAVVVMVAHRYGWIPTKAEGGDGKRSITWHEVEAACQAQKPIFAYLVDVTFPWTKAREQDRLLAPEADPHEVLAAVQALQEFKLVLSGSVRETFRGPDDLAKKVSRDLGNWLIESMEKPASVDADLPSTSFIKQEAIRNYCDRLVNHHEYLPIAGYRDLLRVPIRLEDLYVPLRVMADLRGGGQAVFADAHDAEEKVASGADTVEVPVTQLFQEAEQRGRRGVVVLGDPGSGKTTLLKRVMLWLLRRQSNEVALPSGMLPVFIALRKLGDVEGDLEALIEAELDRRELGMRAGFGRSLLNRGNLLFLFDGMDEVIHGTRAAVARWIDEFATTHPDCRFLVSCRFSGYSSEVRLSERFLETHLRPLSTVQAEKFIHGWYRIVERALSKEPQAAEDRSRRRAQTLIDMLRKPDFRASRVRGLIRNPLLLTILCLVHRNRGQLPRRRVALYDACIEILLEGWREGKGLSAPVMADEGRRVLQPLAYWLHSEQGRTRATAPELVPIVKRALCDVGQDGRTAKEFLERLRNDSGLFTGWDHERYGFMHLGFQEYLAAREIRRLGSEEPSVLQELAKHHGESWWQEVEQLLAALGPPSVFEAYMREVVEQPAFADSPQAAIAVMEDAVEASPQPFLELLDRGPGENSELWARQLQALRLMEAMDPSSLEGMADRLANHPSIEISRWVRSRHRAKSLEVVIIESCDVELVKLPAGSFWMGSSEREKMRDETEGPQHSVTVPEFLMGRYPVTNEQYARYLQACLQGEEPEYWSDGRYNQPRQPVTGLSWGGARDFAKWAGCRLPSEAEWEYAARSGSTEQYLTEATEEALDRVAWYEKNSRGRIHPVGEKELNAWGLGDILGNVWEWVEDDWHDNYEGAPTDGSPWIEKPRRGARVRRGGSYDREPRHLRVAFRLDIRPRRRSHRRGFRLARSLKKDS